MNTARSKSFVVAVLALALLAGCTRDPNLRKQQYLESGNRYFEQHKYRSAAIEYLNAIQIDKDFAAAHYKLAECYLQEGNWGSAYVELYHTTELEPKNLKAQIELGNLLLAGKQFPQAQERAQLVLTQNPNNVDAHILSANAYAGIEDIQQSLRQMQTAIRLNPNRPQSYLNLGRLQQNAKQLAEAEKSFRRAVALDPKSMPAHLALGNFLAREHYWSEAEEQDRLALALQADSPLPYSSLAMLYQAQGRTADAVLVLTEAKQKLPNNPDAYRMLGDFYYVTGDHDKAFEEYGDLYRKHSDDLRVQKNYTQLLILKGRIDQAEKLDDALLKKDPNDVDGLDMRGQILGLGGHPDDAVLAFQAALKGNPQNPVVHFHLGLAYNLAGNSEQAESQWRKAVTLSPQMLPAQRALAELALKTRDWDLLRQSAAALIQYYPSLPDGYIDRANARFNLGDQAAAEADLTRATELAPRDARPFVALANIRYMQKRFPEADKLFEQALDRNPVDANALLGLVKIHLIKKQTAQALERVQQQIARVPDSSAFYLLLGQVEMAEKDLPRAQAAFEKSINLDPNNLDAILNLAQVEIVRGSLQQAMANYQRAMQRKPRDVRAYVLLGSLEESQGNWQDAQQRYRKALDLQPDYSVAANNLAYSLLQHGGNISVALSLAQTARRGLPDSPNTADTLALAYYKNGAYGLAASLLQEAVEKNPLNSTYHYHLGLVYEKQNNLPQARNQFEQALKLAPRAPDADQIRKALAQLNGA
jgi:tetratricopeptide (TPR) repeat protein